MNSILNLNTTWVAANILTYIEHSFSDMIANYYDSLNDDSKNGLKMMETSAAIMKIYVRSKLNLSELNLILKKKPENSKIIIIIIT